MPDLIFYELANALRYSPRFTDKDVKDAIKSVLDIGFDVREPEEVVIEKTFYESRSESSKLL